MSATRTNDTSKNAGPQNQPQARATYAGKLPDCTGTAAVPAVGRASASAAETTGTAVGSASSANSLVDVHDAGQIDTAVNVRSRKQTDLHPPNQACDAETLRILKNLRDGLKGANVSSAKCQHVENGKCSDFRAFRHSSEGGTRCEESEFFKICYFVAACGIVLACFVQGLFGYFVDSFAIASSERS